MQGKEGKEPAGGGAWGLLYCFLQWLLLYFSWNIVSWQLLSLASVILIKEGTFPFFFFWFLNPASWLCDKPYCFCLFKSSEAL